MVQEEITKFIASIIASTSHLTEEGARFLSDKILNFSIFKRDKIEKKIKVKKELPVGGYEAAIGFFGSLEGKR